MWIPVPPSAEAALAGRPSLSTSPARPSRSVGRGPAPAQPDASSRCLAAYLYSAAGEGSRRPTCRGTGRRWSTSGASCWPRRSGSPRTPPVRCRHRPRHAPPGAHADGHLRRQPAHLRSAHLGLPDRRVRTRPANQGTSACGARSTVSRSCPTTRTASPSTATRRTTSRCRTRAASPGDRPAEDRHRRVGGARLDACPHRRGQGDGPAPAAAHRHPRLHDAGIRDVRAHEQRDPAHGALGVTWEARHPPGRDRDVAGDGPPSRVGRRSTT